MVKEKKTFWSMTKEERQRQKATANSNPEGAPLPITATGGSALLQSNSFKLADADSTTLRNAACNVIASMIDVREAYVTKIDGQERILSRMEFDELTRDKGVMPQAKRTAVWWNTVSDQPLLQGIDPLSEESVKAFLAHKDASGETSLCGNDQAPAATTGTPAQLPTVGGEPPATSTQTDPIPDSDTPPNFTAEALRKKGHAANVTLAELDPDQAVEVGALAKKLEREWKMKEEQKKRTAERLAQLKPFIDQATEQLDNKSWERFVTIISLASKPQEAFDDMTDEVGDSLRTLAPDAQSAVLMVLRNPALLVQVNDLSGKQAQAKKQRAASAGNKGKNPPSPSSGNPNPQSPSGGGNP